VSQKLQVSVAENRLVFQRETKDGKIVNVDGDFAFLSPLDNDHALKTLKTEVSGRGNVTRAAISCLVQILNTPRTDGYKGQGNINSDTGAAMPKELKTAMRDAESAFFAPMFDAKQSKQFDTFLTGLREAGIYATCKGVALKYYYFAGKLPCLYVGDLPQTDKLLSVSSMQKLLQNMVEDKPEADDSIAARIGTLFTEFTNTSSEFTSDMLQALTARLGAFQQEVKEAQNILASQRTAIASNPALMVSAVQPAPGVNSGAPEDPFVLAIGAAWDKVETEETAEQA